MLLDIFASISYGNSCAFYNLVLFWWYVIVCKTFVCSEFLDMPQKSWRSKRRQRKLVNNTKIALLGASMVMVITYNIKLFRTGADRHSGILMSLLYLVANTIMILSVAKNDCSQSSVQLLHLYRYTLKLYQRRLIILNAQTGILNNVSWFYQCKRYCKCCK